MAIKGKSEVIIVGDQFLMSLCLYCKTNCTITGTAFDGPPALGFKRFSLESGKGIMLAMASFSPAWYETAIRK